MTDTVDLWRGDFGDTYHQRNRPEVHQTKPVFDRILTDVYPIGSVLEVGCGLGVNLQAIEAKFRAGVEPNCKAREEGQEKFPRTLFLDATADDLPFDDDDFDLVLTCGLLIHIGPDQIRKVVEEIARVSKRYVLCIEYASPDEQMVEYRGVKDALWKRDYGKLMIAWGGMKLLRRDAADSNLYPGCEWWLLERQS